MLAYWAEDPTQEALKLHLARIPDYLWVAEDGMKVQVWLIFLSYITNYIIYS